MTDLRLGTITQVGAAPWKLADDLDATTSMPIDVWTPPNAPTVGDRVLYQVVQGLVVVLSSITAPVRIAAGAASVPIVTANVTATITVTLPTGLFTATPICIAGIATGTTASVGCIVFTGSASTTSFSLSVNRGNTTTTNVWWYAIQV